MQKCLAALLAAAATAMPALAATPATAPAPAPEKPLYQDAGMLVLVAPAFPKGELAAGRTARVDVTALVRTDGTLQDVRLSANPPVEAFASAVMDVVSLWRLQPRIVTPGCAAKETPARVAIWFDIVNGAPKVSYGTSRPEGVAPAELHTDRQPVKMVTPLYPKRLLEDPNAPKAILQVAYVAVAEDGAVTGVTLAPMLHYRDFEPLIAAAVRQWKYAPQPSSWCAEVRFHMTLD